MVLTKSEGSPFQARMKERARILGMRGTPKRETEEVITYTQALREAIFEEMSGDESVIYMGEGVVRAMYPATAGLAECFGTERIIDTPIAEPSFTGAAVGAALGGLRPVVDLMYSGFGLLALSEMHMAATWGWHHGRQGGMKLPIVYRAQMGGFGHMCSDTHSSATLTHFKSIPGLKVVVPTTPYDVKGLFKTAVRDDNPVVFLTHGLFAAKRGSVPAGEYTVPFGQATILREGSDVTLVAIGYMTEFSMKAAEELAKEGVSVEVIDPRTIEPLELGTILNSVHKTGRLVVVEESVPACSVASEIGLLVGQQAFYYLRSPVGTVCAAPVANPASHVLELASLPSVSSICSAVQKAMRD